MDMMRIKTQYCPNMIRIIFSCCLLMSLHLSEGQGQGQTQSQECINNLQPCLNYLSNNRNPPDTCCRPLDYIVKSMPECLCGLMTIQGSNQAQQAGINVTQAQTLPGRCGLRINPLGCITGTPDTRSSTSATTITSFSSTLAAAAAAALSILVILQQL